MNNLEIALSYLKKGLSIIPLYSPEMVKINHPKSFIEELRREFAKNDASDNPLPKDTITEKVLTDHCKKPCISGWKEYQKRLPTRDEVNHWFTVNPSANIAIITGAVSNLVVFDLDSGAAVEYIQEIGEFPESTAIANTGKGQHIYMRHPGFHVNNQVDTNLGMDIRGDGGYVVAPPSMHGSGRIYEWVEGSSILDLDPSPCTPWMIDYLKNVSSNNVATDKKQTAATEELEESIPLDDKTIKAITEIKDQEPKIQETKQDEYLDLLKNGCIKGKRNQSATRLIGHLLKTGMKEPEVWEMIQLWNRDKVKPPIDHNELKKTFESVKEIEKKSQATKTAAQIINIDIFLDDVNGTVNEFKENYVRIPFANTNLKNLENNMNGGFAGGRFYLFGGVPASGKTVLLNNIADNICLNGYPVLFFSYDDGRSELRYRTLSRFSGQSIEEFNRRTIRDIGAICQEPTVKEIMSRKYIVERNIPIEKWTDLIEQIKRKHGKPPVIIIDYLTKLRTEKGNSDERLRVNDILSKLTEIAKIHNTPVIVISELARDSYKSGQRLTMASFKESGAIEYEGSWLGILAAVEEKNGEYIVKENSDSIIKHDGNVDLIVFKTKRGTGATGRIPLKINKTQMTVRDRDVGPVVTKKKKISQFE